MSEQPAPMSDEELKNVLKFGAAAMSLAMPNRYPENTQYHLKLEDGSIDVKVNAQLGSSTVKSQHSMRARSVNKKLERSGRQLVDDVVGEYVEIPEPEKEEDEKDTFDSSRAVKGVAEKKDKSVKENILNA